MYVSPKFEFSQFRLAANRLRTRQHLLSVTCWAVCESSGVVEIRSEHDRRAEISAPRQRARLLSPGAAGAELNMDSTLPENV